MSESTDREAPLRPPKELTARLLRQYLMIRSRVTGVAEVLPNASDIVYLDEYPRDNESEDSTVTENLPGAHEGQADLENPQVPTFRPPKELTARLVRQYLMIRSRVTGVAEVLPNASDIVYLDEYPRDNESEDSTVTENLPGARDGQTDSASPQSSMDSPQCPSVTEDDLSGSIDNAAFIDCPVPQALSLPPDEVLRPECPVRSEPAKPKGDADTLPNRVVSRDVYEGQPPLKRFLDITLRDGGTADTAAYFKTFLTEKDWYCKGNPIHFSYLFKIADERDIKFVVGTIKDELCSIFAIKRTGRRAGRDGTICLLWTKGPWRRNGFVKALFHTGVKKYASDVECIISGTNPTVQSKFVYKSLDFTNVHWGNYGTSVGPLIQRLEKHVDTMTEKGWKLPVLLNEKDQDGKVVLVVDLTDIDEAGGAFEYEASTSSEVETSDTNDVMISSTEVTTLWSASDENPVRHIPPADGDKKKCASVRNPLATSAPIATRDNSHGNNQEKRAAQRAPATHTSSSPRDKEMGGRSSFHTNGNHDQNNPNASKRARVSLSPPALPTSYAKQVAYLERQILGKEYSKDLFIDRLRRLEENCLGDVSDERNIRKRLELLWSIGV